MSKKGFTLIELLAVILILGIIALIAIPTVNNIINESKVGAWKSTANNVISSYERYYQLCQMKGTSCVTNFDGSDATHQATAANVKEQLGLKGDLPATFTILRLNSTGDAILEFTQDNVTCRNFETTATSEPIDMVCARN